MLVICEVSCKKRMKRALFSWCGKSHSFSKVVRSIFHIIIRLAPWADKMNRTFHCDLLPEETRWRYLARSWLPAVSRRKIMLFFHTVNPLLTKLGCTKWLDIGLVLVVAFKWPSTPFRSINTKKNNLVNIQPSWPCARSITDVSKTN